MTATAVLEELQASGVRLRMIATDRLRVEAPRGVVTLELRAALAQYKAEIIAELRRQNQDARRRVFFRQLARDPDAWRTFENQMETQAAILESENGLSQDEALAQAEVMTADRWAN